jgi:histidine triad (HIT) family protein
MGDCIFCRIAGGEAPAHVVYEDEHTIAFLDINPVSRGHTLVIPKRHYRDLLGMPAEELAAVVAAAQRVAGALIEGLRASGVNLLQATGAAAGQTVFHFHLHLIPRYENDGLHPWPKSTYRERDFAATAHKIKEAISSK